MGLLTGYSPSTLALGGFVLALVAVTFASRRRARRYPPDIQPIGAGQGLFAALKNLRFWVQDGYDQYSKNSKAFLLPGMLGNEPQVVIPRAQMQWLLDQPDHVLSSGIANAELLHGDYSFGDAAILRDPYHEHVIHRSLARHLPALVPELEDEVRLTADQVFGLDDKEWKEANVWDLMLQFIPRVTNRMLIGPPVSRNKTYLDTMIAITHDITYNIPLLAMVPPLLKPIIGTLAGLPCKYHSRITKRFTIPVINQLLSDFERKAQGDPALADWVPPNTYLGWHIALARAEGKTSELVPDRIAQRLVPINFAAIHTTALTALNAFLDILYSDAEYGTLKELTEEVRRVYTEENGRWTKASLGKLYRVDSAIRESMRASPFAQTLVQKKVMAKEGLTNPETGWHFEYGTLLTCPIMGTHHDPDIHGEKADAYDPFRFSRLRETFESKDATERAADERLKLQSKGMVTTSTMHFPFGHGRHACPGRFFVAHELKMLFAHLLLNYDLAPISERPQSSWIGGTIIPPLKATIRFKRKAGTF